MSNIDCVFCKIIKKEIPSHGVYENDHVYAFLDIKPNNIGHTLVVPKDHFSNIYETTDDMLGYLIIAAKKIALAIKKGLSADGINIANNNEPAAGQLIFHTHIHIIPRFKEDGFKHWPGKTTYTQQQMQEVSEKIRAEFKT